MHLQAKISVLFIVATLLCSKQTGENSSIVPSNGKTIQSFTPGFTRSDVPTFTFSLNDIADKILSKLGPYLKATGYDPANVSDYHTSFKYIIFSGSFELTRGKLRNTSTMKRAGNVHFTTQDNSIQLNVPLGFKELICSYCYRAKFWNIGPTGHLISTINNIKTNIVMDVKLPANVVTLRDFKVIEAGTMSMVFSQSSLDWLLNWLSHKILPRLEDKIIKEIETTVNTFLEQKVSTNYVA